MRDHALPAHRSECGDGAAAADGRCDRGRDALVSRQAGLHAVFARLRRAHGGCRGGLARRARRVFEEPRGRILRARGVERVALVWRCGRYLGGAAETGIADAIADRGDSSGGANGIGARAAIRAHGGRRRTDRGRGAALCDGARVGMEHAAQRLVRRARDCFHVAEDPGTAWGCASAARTRWGRKGAVIARFWRIIFRGPSRAFRRVGSNGRG